MHILQTILALVVTLGLLVTVHEFGHFWVARRCGVRVLRFSVGFGKPLFSWYDRHGTEFAVAAIPLGGYVKMLDEREAPVPDEERHLAFTSKTPGRRIAIASAGPAANFLFAFMAYWVLSVVGFTTLTPVVGEVGPGSVADRVGLESGMEIQAIDGRPVQSWSDINMRLLERAGEHGEVTVTVRAGATSRQLAGELGGWELSGESPNPVLIFGIEPWRPEVPAQVGEVVADGPADKAGLMPGDRIVQVNGESVADWFALVERIQSAPGEVLDLQVERDGQLRSVSVTPAPRGGANGESQGYLGVGVSQVSWPDHLLRKVQLSPMAALPNAISETWADTRLTLVAIQKMATGLLSPTNLSGPITIARVAEASVSSGFEDFIHFLAYLSVSLGVLNLLPVPILDGGHIVYYTIEAIRRKPLSDQAQAVGVRIGMAMILTLMVFALYNDLMRL